jgi:hypothetical protein
LTRSLAQRSLSPQNQGSPHLPLCPQAPDAPNPHRELEVCWMGTPTMATPTLAKLKEDAALLRRVLEFDLKSDARIVLEDLLMKIEEQIATHPDTLPN